MSILRRTRIPKRCSDWRLSRQQAGRSPAFSFTFQRSRRRQKRGIATERGIPPPLQHRQPTELRRQLLTRQALCAKSELFSRLDLDVRPSQESVFAEEADLGIAWIVSRTSGNWMSVGPAWCRRIVPASPAHAMALTMWILASLDQLPIADRGAMHIRRRHTIQPH